MNAANDWYARDCSREALEKQPAAGASQLKLAEK